MSPTTKLGRIGFTATIIVLVGTLAAEARDNGYSSDPILCHNQAVNDYYDQVAECEKNLSDIPDQLALCKQDAADDFHRRDAACSGNSAALGANGGLMNGGNLTVSPGSGNGGKGKGGKTLGLHGTFGSTLKLSN